MPWIAAEEDGRLIVCSNKPFKMPDGIYWHLGGQCFEVPKDSDIELIGKKLIWPDGPVKIESPVHIKTEDGVQCI